jgi:hypothetical protein
MKFSHLSVFGLKAPRIVQHTGFWLLTLLVLTLMYGIGLPGYWFASHIILIFLPLHMLYFYLIAYVGVPRFLYTKQYARFLLFLLFCLVFTTLSFRLLEILVADPLIYKVLKQKNPDFIWKKLEGDFITQFTKYSYWIDAFEQGNFVVWIALAIKFFKMWYEKQQASLEAELNLLKGQLHPHFLFNTLNNLYALTLNQSPRSAAVVIGLSEILRYMLYETNAEVVPLKRDIEVLESYIDLEKIRYEERLDLSFSINGLEPGQQIVPLLLLPLVENAFKHGTSEKVGEAWINIDLQVKDNLLTFKISNSKPEKPPADDQRKDHSSIGLTNVRKRLNILYPAAHQVRILEEEEIFAVVLEINLDKRLAIGTL